MSSSPVGQHGVGGGEAVVGHQLLRPLGVALLAEEGVAVLQSHAVGSQAFCFQVRKQLINTDWLMVLCVHLTVNNVMYVLYCKFGVV